jgi:hypothetical protein
VIVQEPTLEGLKTTLYDTEDDTSINGTMPYVEVSTAQKLGSNNTYNRRYSLVTILGLEDEDDDGNEASGNNESEAYRGAKEAIDAEGDAETLTKLKSRVAKSTGLKDSEKRSLIKLADDKIDGKV